MQLISPYISCINIGWFNSIAEIWISLCVRLYVRSYRLRDESNIDPAFNKLGGTLSLKQRESDPTREQTCKGGCGEKLEEYAGSNLLQLVGDDGASLVWVREKNCVTSLRVLSVMVCMLQVYSERLWIFLWPSQIIQRSDELRAKYCYIFR